MLRGRRRGSWSSSCRGEVSHKSDIGGVALDVATAGRGRGGRPGDRRPGRRRPGVALDGFALQPMIRRAEAQELILGSAATRSSAR